MSCFTTRILPATFFRGGTSNGILIKASALPSDRAKWQPVLASAMGSPDPYGRQLNGMGSGVSSTSKVMVIEKSTRADADVDYTMVQVSIKDGALEMAGNCGNLSSAVGPFAWDEILGDDVRDKATQVSSGEAVLRLYNTNTQKIVESTFRVGKDGNFDPSGDYKMAGVPGTGSKIKLSFLDPAGARTGKAFPTGNPIDTLSLPDGSSIKASLVDIANPGVSVLASDIGVPGDIGPDALMEKSEVMGRLESIRQEAARRMGLDPSTRSVPQIVMVSPPSEDDKAQGVNITCRALSMQQAHRAIMLTLALNVGVTCGLSGTLPAMVASGGEGKDVVTIAHASGTLDVSRSIDDGNIKSAVLYRTARAMMKGDVFYQVEEST